MGASSFSEILLFDVAPRILDLFGMFLGGLDELIDARRAAELVSFPADDPGDVQVGLGPGDGADFVAGLWLPVVGGLHPFEFLRGRPVAVGFDVRLGVPAARRQVELPFLLAGYL